MDVIPFSVPGLPEPVALASEFIIRPTDVDAESSQGLPRIGLQPPSQAPGKAATNVNADPGEAGLMCIYPGLAQISTLYQIQVRSGQNEQWPGYLLHNIAVSGSCMVLGMGSDFNNNPVLTLSLLPDQYLPNIVTRVNGDLVVDVGAIDDRLEIMQSFTCNALGSVSRLSNTLVHVPNDKGASIFNPDKDTDFLADIASFYMTRALTLSSSQIEKESVGIIPNIVFAITGRQVVFSILALNLMNSFRYSNGNVSFVPPITYLPTILESLPRILEAWRRIPPPPGS